jgi:glycosyltransferase involved in cell wall biosynthesis
MIEPLLSVVLTTFNRSQLLKNAIDSVLGQTLSCFELIVVDDCSTDDTIALLATYADPRLRFIRHTTNSGVSAARNTGISAARAEYISFLDDDDQYLPTFLEETQDCIKRNPGLGFLWTGVVRVDAGKGTRREQLWHASRMNGTLIEDNDMLFLTSFASSFGFTVAKTSFDKVGLYDTGLTLSEDLDLIFRLAASQCDYFAIPSVLVQINVMPGSSLSRTSVLLKHVHSAETLVRRHQQVMHNFPSVWLHYHTVLMANYYRSENHGKARATMRSILRKRFFYGPVWERLLRFEFKSWRRRAAGKRSK